MPLFLPAPTIPTIPSALMINVKDTPYNARGNGIVDDTAAFALAISAASSINGTVFVPVGTYKISGIILTNLTDVTIMGAGTGSIIAPISGSTAFTITNCVRCPICDLKIDGSINGGAIGISINGDYDAKHRNLFLTSLSGDAIYIQGDNSIGNEIYFNNVTCRNNGGYAYHYVRTTTDDTGGIYLTNFKANFDTQGLGGINIDGSAAPASVGVFHFGMNIVLDGYSGVPLYQLHNVNNTRIVNGWFEGNNSTGPIILLDGDGYMNGIDQAVIYNGGSSSGSYGMTINGTQHDNLFNLIEFDGSPIAFVHCGTTGVNNILGVYNTFGSSPLTDTVAALWGRGSVIQQYGAATFETPGNAGTQCLGLDDTANPGNQVWLRNSGGSFQMVNTAFTSVVFTVDSAGDTLVTTISTAESSSEQVIATSGTINTTGIGEAKVAPAGNVTGIILQAGIFAGQECVVTNNSAFTVTFAAVGTSHVADGVSAIIPANRAMFFKWSSSSSKWFHV
jgi:hypothetical protein